MGTPAPGLTGPKHPLSSTSPQTPFFPQHDPTLCLENTKPWHFPLKLGCISSKPMENLWEKTYGEFALGRQTLMLFTFARGKRKGRTGVFIFLHWKENLALFHVCAVPTGSFSSLPAPASHTPWSWLPLPAVCSSVRAVCFAVFSPILV